MKPQGHNIWNSMSQVTIPRNHIHAPHIRQALKAEFPEYPVPWQKLPESNYCLLSPGVPPEL